MCVKEAAVSVPDSDESDADEDRDEQDDDEDTLQVDEEEDEDDLPKSGPKASRCAFAHPLGFGFTDAVCLVGVTCSVRAETPRRLTSSTGIARLL